MVCQKDPHYSFYTLQSYVYEDQFSTKTQEETELAEQKQQALINEIEHMQLPELFENDYRIAHL